MPAVLVKEEKLIDSKGNPIVTETWEDFEEEPPIPPSATRIARNVRRSHSEGKYVLTFDRSPFFDEGEPGQGNGSTDSYSVEGSLSQEPIETHPKFKTLTVNDWKNWRTWKDNPADPALNGWKPSQEPTDSPLYLLWKLYSKGITDYLVPRAVVRERRNETSPPNLSRLGKIQPPQNAPNLPSGGNWLLSGVSGTQEQNASWTNSYEYLSSGENGWNNDIYA